MAEIPSTVTIRFAAESDAPGIARLLHAMAGAGWFSALANVSAQELEEKIRRDLATLAGSAEATTLVAETGEGTIVGYCHVHWLAELFMLGPEGYLSELFLLPEARGQRIGTALLDRVVAEAESRGAFRLMLLNGRQRESYSRGFYEKNGWEEREGMANFVYWVKQP